MVQRRRWVQLFPVVSLRELGIYNDLLIRIFSANPGISGSSLHCFLLSAYGVNVSEDELQTWLYSCLMHCTECLWPYDELLKGCYTVKHNMPPDYFCGLLADAGVSIELFAIRCWLLLQPPLNPSVYVKDYKYCLKGGWELLRYDDFLRGCCIAMPGIGPLRLRVALMQTMGETCVLADIVRWMRMHRRLCKPPGKQRMVSRLCVRSAKKRKLNRLCALPRLKTLSWNTRR